MDRSFFVKQALLETGWADNVLITVSAEGVIDSITENSELVAADEFLKGILIPGMPNLHCHAFQKAFAGLAESRGHVNDSFWTWRKTMYQFVDKLKPFQVRVIAQQLYIEMLKAGYTSVAEFHYLHHNKNGDHYDDPAEMSHSVINAAISSGIAITHLPVYYRYSGFNQQSAKADQRRFVLQAEDFQNLLSSLFSNYSSEKNLIIGIAPHSLRALTASDINAAVLMLDDYDASAPIHIHIAEQIAEVIGAQAQLSQRPIEHLLEHCEVNKRWCLIHATHSNEQEILDIANSGATVGLCLTTEANLGDGFFPADQYFKQQGAFGIGSDSNISVSPIRELQLLEYGQRLKHQKRTLLCDDNTLSVGRYLYQGALIGGAQALGRKTGKIAAGYQADWLLLDPNHPALLSKQKDQILDAMIFASNTNPVTDVMVGGQWVVQSGHHPLEEQSLRDYQRVLAELIE